MKRYYEELPSQVWSMWQYWFPPKNFFENSKVLCLTERRILYFWQVVESIHKFIIELHVLQCLFVRGSNEKQRKDKIISNFTKEETFSSVMTTKVLLGEISQYAPPSCTLQKRPFSPLQFGQEENIPGHSTEGRTYWYVLKLARVLPIPTGRVRLGWWTLS